MLSFVSDADDELKDGLSQEDVEGNISFRLIDNLVEAKLS